MQDCLCAGPAFNVGMLYGNLDETHDIISKWDKDKIINAYLEAPEKGFNTQLMGKDLLYWASTLLDLSRIDYGELKLNIEELSINEHINKAIDSLKNLGKRKNISIKCSCSKGKIVLADKNALERILNNLIENAFKYSDSQSTINISTKKVKDHSEISVKDSGRGIPNEEQDFLFDRFYRTAEARATEEKGSGLGLAIVKNLVNNLNGEVGVKNAKPQGSIFWFTLPLKTS